jgi:predicted O-methyltransferase YrrM
LPGLTPRQTLLRRRLRSPHTASRAASAQAVGGHDFYGGAVVGATTIGARAVEPLLVDGVVREACERDPDAYVEYVQAFAVAGRSAAGSVWRYADIATVLAAAAELLTPQSYLEIGVRRGRSLCVVVSRMPACNVVGVDLWNEGYAGIENPGPEHVRKKAAAAGHRGSLELLSGSSHQVLPRLFRDRPRLDFDLITVDGDHTRRGAARDLRTVLPRLRIGGALVFDDISHPAHPYLHDVWAQVVERDRRYATWTFDDVGYGVAVAVRRW